MASSPGLIDKAKIRWRMIRYGETEAEATKQVTGSGSPAKTSSNPPGVDMNRPWDSKIMQDRVKPQAPLVSDEEHQRRLDKTNEIYDNGGMGALEAERIRKRNEKVKERYGEGRPRARQQRQALSE